MSAPRFVLWGPPPADVDGTPIKVEGGNYRDCGSELRQRTRDGGWTALLILPEGQTWEQYHAAPVPAYFAPVAPVATSRFTGKCHRCAHRVSVDGSEVTGIDWYHGRRRGSVFCTPCGDFVRMTVFEVKGTQSAKPCDARCVNATGVDCECSCIGRNHGQKWMTS